MNLPHNATNPEKFVADLCAWIEQEGVSYYDETVTQLDHALQSAYLAAQESVERSQVVAALLHDIGHLIIDEHSRREDFLSHDAFHEKAGCLWANRFFGDPVSEPIRLHVPAKRWLCTTDDAYYERLSDSSKHSFTLQGGMMSSKEAAAFEAEPFSKEAVKLRLWDDKAKVTNKKVPAIIAYQSDLLACLHVV
ncbi:MAG: hypothetical protein KTR18_11595 [Acidiferrobacterales bacterium]|nr:hypothetical protein [Acidiferrobacterales bacterium]